MPENRQIYFTKWYNWQLVTSIWISVFSDKPKYKSSKSALDKLNKSTIVNLQSL